MVFACTAHQEKKVSREEQSFYTFFFSWAGLKSNGLPYTGISKQLTPRVASPLMIAGNKADVLEENK